MSLNEHISFQSRREYENNDEITEAEKSRLKTMEICRDLHRIMSKSLASVAPHLLEAEVDIEPRHAASWMAGGNSKHITIT